MAISQAIQVNYSELITDFMNIIIHDLKSPLASLKMFFTMMDDMEDSEKLKLFPELEKLTFIPFNILTDFTGVLRGNENDFHEAELNFEMIIKELIEEFNDKIAKEKAQIILTGETATTFFYIKPLIKSLLRNLISNSLKYREKDLAPEIKINIEKKERILHLTYEDNGLGIDIGKYKKQLFEPYCNINKNSNGGMGLGMYIIKNIVERNGGDIKLVSAPGKGTTFYINTAIQSIN